jgi:hypothetical protein
MSSMMANGIDDSGFPVMYIDPVYATVTHTIMTTMAPISDQTYF